MIVFLCQPEIVDVCVQDPSSFADPAKLASKWMLSFDYRCGTRKFRVQEELPFSDVSAEKLAMLRLQGLTGGSSCPSRSDVAAITGQVVDQVNVLHALHALRASCWA